MTDRNAFEHRPFIPLSEFSPPPWPEREALKMALRRARRLLTRHEERPIIAEDRLQRDIAALKGEDQLALPHCEPLFEELSMTLDGWSQNPRPPRWLQLIVLPPGYRHELLGAWAERHGHQVLPPPQRDALLREQPVEIPPLQGEGVLVVPRLEAWFMRHRCGLEAIRRLLEQLAGLERHCVIGCQSWGWAYLGRAIEAHLMLPEPFTFQPFDERRLCQWLSTTIADDDLAGVRFRLRDNGQDIFATDDSGAPESNYFETLAARSRGIPWVARDLWRNSLRSRIEAQEEEAEGGKNTEPPPFEDEQTLWVVALNEFSLPGSGDPRALLILHALLIHGSLARAELERVLPDPGPRPMLHALLGAGLLERHEDRLRIVPAAYPAIRNGLETAGFPLDRN